jgi:phospho-N-acetylmuramoyl-pentapeptide-transferase
MLWFLSQSDWAQQEGLTFLRLFGYVTFRAGGAAFTAFLIAVLFGPFTVRTLKRLDAMGMAHVPEHQGKGDKDRTPTMGGILILASIVISTLLWAPPTNPLVIVFLGLLLALGLVGFFDDYRKLMHKNTAGLAGRWKLVFQAAVGGTAVWFLHAIPSAGDNVTKLMLPFFKDPVIENMAVWCAISFGALVVVASSNAVNLTDGMDGLAIGCTIICAGAYAVFAYCCGHAGFADYLHIPFVPGASEVVVIATAIAGAGLGFLWHNCLPAAMYMGDTGSLSIGGAIGLIAVLVKQELLLILVGGVFVVEAMSVVLQVGYFKFSRKLTGTPKRIFRCAPIHHHFEQTGWDESKVVVRFWIIAALLAAAGLATLKLR